MKQCNGQPVEGYRPSWMVLAVLDLSLQTLHAEDASSFGMYLWNIIRAFSK